MIGADQPPCFPNDVTVVVSSRDDGTMLDRSTGRHHEAIVTNRRDFCAKNNIDYENIVYQRIEYGVDQSYAHIEQVTTEHTTAERSDIKADALITTQPGVGLFLPLADCIGLVLYDPSSRTLALLHMGRHSTLTDLIQRVITMMVAKGAKTSDIIAYMSPSVGKDSYRMEYFEAKDDIAWQPYCSVRPDGVYLNLIGYNYSQLLSAGVADKNIQISSIDTVKNDNYFSHFAGDTTGRFAVLAVMR